MIYALTDKKAYSPKDRTAHSGVANDNKTAEQLEKEDDDKLERLLNGRIKDAAREASILSKVRRILSRREQEKNSNDKER